ncbi:CoA transferase [Nocardioides sp. NPDC006273]|uniref:CaiB/BaiF CoA transferase family protein n=1 Tax=Nocardioides sp. NPDC006273 TaxID=3155598 RepID=UPI00339EA118
MSAGGEQVDWSFLSGRRIIDCSALIPGPYATVLLADLGADVLKVERPQGDLSRFNDRRFSAFNRNKRSVVLDLKTATGRDAFLDLARTADAVVEGFRPGVMDRLGLGWDVLRRVNPGLVMCSISGFGQDGPYAHKPGHDLNFLGLSGFFGVPARADGLVTRPGVRVADLIGGLYAALSLSVALASVERTGVGQHLDVSLTDATAACFAPFTLALPEAAPATSGELVMGDNDVFDTQDGGRLVLAAFEDTSWRLFRTSLAEEFPELRTDEYDDRLTRTRHADAVGALLRTVFQQRPLVWWHDRLSALEHVSGLPWTPLIATPSELLEHPVLHARELFVPTISAEGDLVTQARFPTRFSNGLDTFRSPAPKLGEHDHEPTRW